MNSWRKSRSVFWVAAAMLLGMSPAALARGALVYDRDACILKIGPDFMYFTGYQPAAPRKKFCEDIPSTGPAIIVLDYAQSEMREMKADFRIILDSSDQSDVTSAEANTVAYVPPKVYPNGTLNFEHVFRETGNYVGIVSVEGAHGEHWVSRFPFSVGKSYKSQLPYYLIALAAALALALTIVNQRQSGRMGSKRH